MHVADPRQAVSTRTGAQARQEIDMAPGATAIQQGRWRGTWEAIDQRLGLSGLAYPVPAHANGIGYILGGITFFGLLILATTGIWLAQYYHATPATARESVVYITNVAPLGDLMRGIHFWVSNIVMATALLHMGRIFEPSSTRGANWLWAGLLAVTLVLSSRASGMG
jgi:ubiquinol-cytochrome c reductase cytochrome b subunit